MLDLMVHYYKYFILKRWWVVNKLAIRYTFLDTIIFYAINIYFVKKNVINFSFKF